MTTTKQELTESREFLTDIATMKDYETTVFCVLRHVSRSGMQRTIDLFVVRNGGIIRIGFHAARLAGYRWDSDRQGIKVNGCGMDMGFAVVDNLRRRMGFSSLSHTWV